MKTLRAIVLGIGVVALSAGVVACGGGDKKEATTPEKIEANPCEGKTEANPCEGKTEANPCEGKKEANPCEGKKEEANPCAPKNPCG